MLPFKSVVEEYKANRARVAMLLCESVDQKDGQKVTTKTQNVKEMEGDERCGCCPSGAQAKRSDGVYPSK